MNLIKLVLVLLTSGIEREMYIRDTGGHVEDEYMGRAP